MPGLFIPFSRWQPQTGRRLEELLQHHFEIYFDLISVSFFPMCVCFLFAYLFGLGVQCQTFCHPLFSRLFFRIAFLACDLHEPFGQRLNSQIDGNLFFFWGSSCLVALLWPEYILYARSGILQMISSCLTCSCGP